MKTKLVERTWISPVVTAAFVVIGATGALLFFHVKNGPLMMLHKWFGWGFIVAGGVHLILNGHALATYVRHRRAMVALLLSAAVAAGLTVAGGSAQERRGVPATTVSVMAALDTNGDGVVDAAEAANAQGALSKLDKNGDGVVSAEELILRGSGDSTPRQR